MIGVFDFDGDLQLTREEFYRGLDAVAAEDPF